MVVNNHFKRLPLERKEEIRDIAIQMNNLVNNYFLSVFETDFYLPKRLSKAYYFFRNQYQTILNDAEKSVFYLYVIFPDDEEFITLLNNYDKDYDQVAKLYQISPAVVKFRHSLQKNIMLERSFIDFKAKKKTMN